MGAIRMNLLHIMDLKDGHVQMSWQRGNEISSMCQRPIPFSDPLSVEDRQKLRWYLEDYLQFPYGAEEYRARQVERRMEEWGESLFKQIFDSESDTRLFYHEAVREGYERCELCISSEVPDFLNIPWELIRDPVAGYLAPFLGGLYRRPTSQRIGAPMELSSEGPFRILLVVSRPYGERDVPLGTIARPMLEALRPWPGIQLEVLRPPTFDAFVERLNARRGYYQLVHFDGHGVSKVDGGYLVFEKEDGSPHMVSSRELSQLLATSRVPLFVLNACQSAEEGKAAPFSSVASQLIAVGAKGVLAMSYSVYVTAAVSFLQRFYESLVGHSSLAEAVAAARRKLYADPDRESMVGSLKLRDWMVPALYQQEHHYVPVPESTCAASPEERSEQVALRQRVEEICPQGRFGFIGRDYDILRVERALRGDKASLAVLNDPCVLLTGIGGAGKTELVFGFARWFAETGGCPGGVFITSFKEKADFGQVIGSIVGYGTDFSSLTEEEQWHRLVSHLRETPCLLVWDNFEPVSGYPEGTEPLATDEDLDKLSRFLKALRGGKSSVLITTRKPDENWLGIAYELIQVTGLTDQNTGQLARSILRTVGRRPEDFRDDPDYARLIRLLRGHPRSLEVILPHLRRKSPTEIIEALQHRVDSFEEAMEDASLVYAFSQMSPRTQRHLPFIGLFASYVHANTLRDFVAADDERQQAYADVVGEALDAQSWEAVLEEAGQAGLLRPLLGRTYELHPTFSPFLRRELASMVGEDGLRRLDSEFMKSYSAWSARYFEGVDRSDQEVLAVVDAEEPNLIRALRLAETDKNWVAARAIVQILSEFYNARGRTDEWDALRGRLLNGVGHAMSSDARRC